MAARLGRRCWEAAGAQVEEEMALALALALARPLVEEETASARSLAEAVTASRAIPLAAAVTASRVVPLAVAAAEGTA